MKKSVVFILSLVGLSVFFGHVQAQVPERPAIQRLVNDFSGIFSLEQRQGLERELVAFDNATTSQICVVTVEDLQGEDISMAAYRILSEWGIGSAKNNNGVVILLEHRPATAGGRVAISVGYGLEGVLTDALSKRIISNHMIPYFRKDAYYEGVREGVLAVMAAAEEEYGVSLAEEEDGSAAIILFAAVLISLLVFLLIIAIANKRIGPTNLGGNNKKGPGMLEMIILANLLGGKNRGPRSGHWGGGSGSGGSFGGGGFGGGGFGGFGGGMGGGGGASGSW